MLFFEIILQIPYFLTNFAVFNSENRLHLGKIQILFGFSLGLINFLTLRNENLFSFPSLNRNFALSLHRKWLLSKL